MYKKIFGILICMLFIITSINIIPNITNIVKADITTGLLGYWNFNEGIGTIANDSSGNNNDGLIIGATWIIGISGNALSFDGVNDYVNVGQFTQFGNTQPFSICAWIKKTSIQTGEPSIMSNMYSSSKGIMLYSKGNEQAVTVGGKDGSNGQATVFEYRDLTNGEWHFIVGTYDGNNLCLYSDGNPIDCRNDFSYYTSSSQNMNIGRMEEGNRYYFEGIIDEVRIYNRALDLSEVQFLYNYPSGNKPPIADINGPYNGNVDEIINLDSSGSTDSDGFIFSYEWDLDDDGIFDDASGATPSWSWSTGGSYPISLKVIDNEGANDTDGSTVYVNEFPIADANGPYYANKSETIFLDGANSFDSDGSIVSYAWDLDNDGTFDDASGATPSWSWSESGTYTIGLKVTDDDGASDTDASDVFIELDEYPPIASFTYSPEQPKIGNMVSFDASGSSDPDGSIVSFSWDFGDDTTGTGMITNHMYSDPARYTVVLTVLDNDGNFDNNSVIIEIGIQGDLPVAYFTFSPDSPCVNETVLFDASSSFSPVGVIESYVWDFGDNNSGTGMIINHNYTVCGNFSVKISVFDNRCFNDSFTKIICINLSQVPNIVINRISGSLGISANITNIGTGTANDISWSIDVEADFGLILSGAHTEYVIDELSAGTSETIKSSGLRGIGFVTITVQVVDVIKKATAFLLGPLVLRVTEI